MNNATNNAAAPALTFESIFFARPDCASGRCNHPEHARHALASRVFARCSGKRFEFVERTGCPTEAYDFPDKSGIARFVGYLPSDVASHLFAMARREVRRVSCLDYGEFAIAA